MAFHQQIPNNTIRGHLKVLERTNIKEGKYFLQKCECLLCGNIIYRNSNTLSPSKDHFCMECEKSKNLKSHFIDLTGQIFGDYLILERDKEYRKDKTVRWKCKCLKCGEIISRQSSYIKSNKGNYCKKDIIRSYGEEEINRILTENNFIFEREFNFEPEDDYTRHMKFDFFIEKRYVIEQDGIQHFYPIDFFGGEEIFKRNQQVDKIKTQQCLQHDIPIIRIPYWKKGEIILNDLLPQYSQFLIKEEKENVVLE